MIVVRCDFGAIDIEYVAVSFPTSVWANGRIMFWTSWNPETCVRESLEMRPRFGDVIL